MGFWQCSNCNARNSQIWEGREPDCNDNRFFPEPVFQVHKNDSNVWSGGRGSWKSWIANRNLSQRYNLISIFVDNLPVHMNRLWLKNMFGKYGKVLDSYIPFKRRLKTNSRFGFIRFKSIKEAREAIRCLNGIDILGFSLHVQLAKYGFNNRIKHVFKKSTKWIPRGGVVSSKDCPSNLYQWKPISRVDPPIVCSSKSILSQDGTVDDKSYVEVVRDSCLDVSKEEKALSHNVSVACKISSSFGEAKLLTGQEHLESQIPCSGMVLNSTLLDCSNKIRGPTKHDPVVDSVSTRESNAEGFDETLTDSTISKINDHEILRKKGKKKCLAVWIL